MPGIVMNVGPKAISTATGGASSGGQTLGAAQGTITINVTNVTQANNLLQNSAKQIQQAFVATSRAAQASSRAQVAAARATAAQSNTSTIQQINQNKTLVSNTQTAAKQITAGLQVQTAQVIANNKQQVSNTQSASKSIVAAQNVQTANIKTQVQQGKLAYQAASQAASLSYQQQSNAAKTLMNTQKVLHQSFTQGTQQQILGNRLIISGLNLQAAQARATARAQQQAAQAAITGWQRFNTQLNEIRTELAAVSVAAGLLSAAGIRYAATLQEGRLQLNAMAGSIQEGGKLMERLAEMGKQARVPMRDMLSFSNQLLPVLEGNTKQLDEWFNIVRRLATLNRAPGVGGVSGATFSLREAFLSAQQGGRDFVSLADRFNISKKALSTALDETGGDFLRAVDLVLDRMGITTELADEMGQSFNNNLLLAKESALALAEEGFGPLIAVLGNVLATFADWAGVISDTHPELAVLASGLLAVIAVGTPLLLLINQMAVAWAAMGIAAQQAIGKMTRVGGLVAAGVIGFSTGKEVGIGIGGAIRTSRGQEPLERAQVEENLRSVVFNFLVDLGRNLALIERAFNNFAATLLDGAALIYRTLATINDRLAELALIPGLKQDFEDRAERNSAAAFSLEQLAQAQREAGNRAFTQRFEQMAQQAERFGIEGFGGAAERVSAASGFSQDQEEIIVDTYKKITALTRDTNRQLVAENVEYNRQRITAEREYQKSLSREARDFARQRLLEEQRFAQQIADMAADAALERTRWMEDLERTIQDRREDLDEENEEAREDSAKKINEIEKEYAKDRERALEDHRDRILKAASRLDAEAIRDEELRFAKETRDAKERRDDQITKEKESLDERIKDQEEAFEEFEREQRESLERRFEEQKEDDESQLERMRRDFEAQKKQADDERAIRLADQATDHQDQLDELDRMHDLRIEQIHAQAAEERQAIWDEHQERLAQTNLMTDAWIAQHERLVQNAIAMHKEFWQGMQEAQAQFTGPSTPTIENPFGADMPAQIIGASSRTVSRNISVGSLILQIVGSTNMGEAQIYSVVNRALYDAFKKVAAE